jgi:hypothetical protein
VSNPPRPAEFNFPVGFTGPDGINVLCETPLVGAG